MTRRILIALLVSSIAAPAAAQNSTGLETMVKLRGFQQKIKLDTLVIWNQVHGSPAAAYTSAKQFLDSLKMKIHVADSVRGVLHADFHTPPSSIAGRQRSWTIKCGSGLAGDYADSWRLSLTYVVYIQPGKGDTTRIGSAFFAGVDPIEGVSKASMPCPSTGNMERLLFKAVQLRVLQLPGAVDQR